jgi:hypothetical protein
MPRWRGVQRAELDNARYGSHGYETRGTTMMLKVYGQARSRAMRTLWIVEELSQHANLQAWFRRCPGREAPARAGTRS